MEVDAVGEVRSDPLGFEAAAVAAEKAGYAGIGLPETRHDVFLSAALAARATERITLQTAIAVAFARNPMTVAIAANDVQLVSGGRLQLGLGSQVKPHVERRFGMPWGSPAARMEDFVAAVRAIWAAWAGAGRLRHEGAFYRHTLMTEMFDPGPNPHGTPPILLAAVGPRMTEVAGRVADGLLCHSLTTRDYLRDVTLPAVRRARAANSAPFTVALPVLVAVGTDEAGRAAAAAGVRRQLAFYASTPAYRGVLDHHGWGELGERLNRLSRQHAWQEMADAIDDDVLTAFAVSGTPSQVAAGVRERYEGLVDRVSLYSPDPAAPGLLEETARLLDD